MPQTFSPNADPRYYSTPAAFRATIGAAAIAAFPSATTVGGTQASATVAFTAQPAALSTLAINGVTITFVTSGGFSLANAPLNGTVLGVNGVPLPLQGVGPYGLQVTIGVTLQATLLNLLGLLRSWPDENFQASNYRVQGGNTLLITAAKTGTAGNAIVVATAAGTNTTVTGAATVASGTAGSTTLTGGTAPTSGYAVLVEPQPQPVEIQAAWGICRASQTAGTMTLFESDGTVLSKVDAVTFPAGNTLSASQELVRLPFSFIAAATTLVVPSWTGLYAYGSTTQVIDINAAPAGIY